MINEHANARSMASVSTWRSVRIDGISESLGSVLEEKSTGRTFLKVVEYPWGVEFDVVDVEGAR